MSDWTNEVCKAGVTIQGYSTLPGNGWAGVAIQGSGISIPNHITALGNKLSKSAPRWASDMMSGNFVLERTKMWGYTRDPKSLGGGDYTLEFDFHGSTNAVVISAYMMHIWRASDKGMDQGATAGYMRWRNVSIYNTSGALIYQLNDDGVNEVNFAEWAWNGVRLGMDFSYNSSVPIGRVYVHFYIGPGHYAAHSIGDRSPGYGFNPSIPIGAYYPRNLNEISSDAVSIMEDPASGYMRPLIYNWHYGAWWVDLGKIYENVNHWPGQWDLGNTAVARMCTLNDFTIQGYKDKYSPHAHLYAYIYINDVQVYVIHWYPSGGTGTTGGKMYLVNSNARIYKYVMDVTFSVPAGPATLKVLIKATNSNEESVSVGWANADTSFA